MTRRLDLQNGVVFVHHGSRGCTVSVPSLAFTLRDRRELDEVIAALMAVREELIEERPRLTFNNFGTGRA